MDNKNKERRSGFGNCYYLKFSLFAKEGMNFYCKKKQTHEFNCQGCPYKKQERLYK